MKGIFWLLFCALLGEVLSRLLHGALPGGVLGMVLLFAGLQTRVIREDDVRTACRWVVEHMMLFFVPVGVGLTAAWELISRNLWAIAAILLLTTLAVLATVGLLQQRLDRAADTVAESEPPVPVRPDRATDGSPVGSPAAESLVPTESAENTFPRSARSEPANAQSFATTYSISGDNSHRS